MVYVKIGSHRARAKLETLLGYRLKGRYNLAVNYHLYEIPESMLEEAMKIKGITKGTMKEIVKDGTTFAFYECW